MESVSRRLQGKISEIVHEKSSNVIVSVDFTNPSSIIDMIENLCDFALGFKLHSDIIDFNESLTKQQFYDNLMKLKEHKKFIIIEDRKFSDIGNTVKLQSKFIVTYADLITVHALPGISILDGLKENCTKNNCGVLLIGQMSCADNLLTLQYTRKTVEIASRYSEFVVGFISQERLEFNGNFLCFTPGVKITQGNDSLGQQYNTPSNLLSKGTDIFIVGRGIYECDEPLKALKTFNHLCDKRNIEKQKENNNNELECNESYLSNSLIGIRDSIVECGILKNGTFKLSSGETSPIYADFRLLTSIPELRERVAKAFSEIIEHTNQNTANIVLMGVPMGGIALASFVASCCKMPLVVMRDKRKEYGAKNLIEGMDIETLRTKKIIVIEDVITTGGSVKNLIEKLKYEEKLDIHQVICILDRNKGGIDMLKREYGLKTNSIFCLGDFVKTQ